MAHKTQQQYPQFAELLLLHSKITGSSALKIESLVAVCNPDMLRQHFLMFTKFFLNESNRIQYFDSQHPSSSTNQSIITALSDAFRRYPASNASPSPFDQLPTMLLSKCISFLSQKDRCAVLRVNKLFVNAAFSIAKYHLVINRAFLKRNKSKTAQQILSFHNLYSVGALTIKNAKSHRHSLWNDKSMEKVKYVLTKNNIKTMHGNPPLVKVEGSKYTKHSLYVFRIEYCIELKIQKIAHYKITTYSIPHYKITTYSIPHYKITNYKITHYQITNIA